MIVEERIRLHPVPALAHTLAFGADRTVDDDSTIRFGSARYSVPHILIGEKVWARVSGDELVIVDASPSGAREVARHKLTTPGNPRIEDAHYPERSGAIRFTLAPARRALMSGHSWPSVTVPSSGSSRPRQREPNACAPR